MQVLQAEAGGREAAGKGVQRAGIEERQERCTQRAKAEGVSPRRCSKKTKRQRYSLPSDAPSLPINNHLPNPTTSSAHPPEQLCQRGAQASQLDVCLLSS